MSPTCQSLGLFGRGRLVTTLYNKMATLEEPLRATCAVLHGKKDLRIEERAFNKKPGKGEVLLAIRSVGICGSDIHFWTDGSIGDRTVVAPTIMGHESSAVVTSVGEGVTSLQPGDRVAMEPGIPCYKCFYCKGGRYNHCPTVRFGSTPPINGFLTNYVVHPADFCFKLPDHVSFDEGALLEPVSVAVHACRRGEVSLGSKVLVCGAGPIGLVCLMTAKACGASQVIVTDLDPNRLSTAKQCGADYTVLINKGESSQELAKRIKQTLGGCLPDRSIECSGAASAISTAIYATCPGGIVIVVGLGAPNATIPIVSAAVREVDIRGVFRYVNCFPAALELISTGKINTSALITHHYSLKDTLSAFEMAAKGGREGAVKVVVDCTETPATK